MPYPTTKPWETYYTKDAASDIAKAVLNKFDEEIGPDLCNSMMASAKERALHEHEAFIADVKAGVTTKTRTTWNNKIRDEGYRQMPQYTVCDKDGLDYYDSKQTIENQQNWEAVGRFSCNDGRAEIDAYEAFQQGRAHFFFKIDGKLGEALAGRKGDVEELKITLSRRLPVEGSIFVQVDSKTAFLMRLYMKHCYSNQGTPYWQYPATFHDVVVNDEIINTPSLSKLSKAMGEAYGVVERTEKAVVEQVEPTKQNLKALANLLYLMSNEERLEESAAEARKHHRMSGRQGPRVQINRNLKKLGMDKDSTLEDVAKVFKASAPKLVLERYLTAKNEGYVARGKRGSDEAAADKLLVYMEFFSLGRNGYELAGYGKRIKGVA